MSLSRAMAVAIGCLAALGLATQSPNLGIVGQRAPAWGVSQWLNLPKGATTLDIGDFKGKVLYLYGFQAWCPGCHRHGFPALKQIIAKYGKDPDVGVVAIQTTFEGFAQNGFKQAKQIAKQYVLTVPIGQSGSAEKMSEVMARYRTGGTPWVIIVDRNGVVRFNDFHLEAQEAIKLIDQLKNKPASPN